MSKRNSNKKHHKRTSQSVVAMQESELPSSATREQKPTTLDVILKYNGVFALIVSFAAIWISQRQTNIAQATLDLQSGNHEPKSQMADVYPQFVDFLDHERSDFAGINQPLYDSLIKMSLKTPMLYINNTGDYPIDSIKLETRFLEGILNGKLDFDFNNPPSDWHKSLTPVILKRVEKEEIQLPQLWKPGTGIQIPIMKGLIGQMMRVQSKTLKDTSHLGLFEISVFLRCAGSSVYHYSGQVLKYPCIWKPSGFSEIECQNFLETYQEKIEFGPIVPVNLKNVDRQTFNTRIFNGKSFETSKLN
ncbi:hypothetical protein [Tuwongella immobilis]|uniref:Uncharacterized protein n=1 Tax=Tuwongella immobilis TaxID=692036 RepID=A0A6C2YNY2_9BACT|nr:hypothetical protein [Tuwongella immobilis]VIP03077.1 unnamed protein product [Tuwongella immobilis]VTS03318.1 unnamed protein product [Tuwongella immobilis]